MSITSGYNKYKRYTKLSNGTYKLVSQWTNSNTVEMDNGSTLQATLGNTPISGIGDGTVTGAIDSLNSNLTNKIQVITLNVETYTVNSANSSYVGISTSSIDAYCPTAKFIFAEGGRISGTNNSCRAYVDGNYIRTEADISGSYPVRLLAVY